MGKINVLSFEVANLIAAGEVVDRPASVIKELMENAIDSGADRIAVEIQHGGITFMSVSDNGCGMEADELPIAIRRHATSKIKDASDLEGIMTLGFRGEALAAIASVSRLRIISKPKGAQTGAMLEADRGSIVGVSERGASEGTRVIVEDLFANVPARRKFLKKDATESAAVVAYVEKIALSRPDIAFRLIVDGSQKIDTVGDGNLKNTIYSLYGKEFTSKLLAADIEIGNIKVSGFIGRTDNVKANRNYQNFFINGRYVKSRTASAAIEQAYTSYIPPEKFPCCVLRIDVNPNAVDVNVHPAKLEVKFSDERPVFEAVYYAVRGALEANVSRPTIDPSNIWHTEKKVSEATVPIENGRAESLKKRQIEAELYTRSTASAQSYNAVIASEPKNSEKTENSEKSGEKSAFEHITAEQYLKEYLVHNSAKVRPTRAKDPSEYPPIVPLKEREQKNDVKAEQVITKTQMPTPTPPSVKTPEPEKTQSTPKNTIDDEIESEDIRDFQTHLLSVRAERKAKEQVRAEEEKRNTEQKYEDEAKKLEYRIVGEVFNSYVIVERGDKMLIIDKHAAHERIIFEEFRKKMLSEKPTLQYRMMPLNLLMLTEEVQALEEYKEEVRAIGFEFTTGKNEVNVLASPEGLDAETVYDMLAVIAERIINSTGSAKLTRDIIFEKALYQASCKAAIKAGREYAKGHIEWLVAKLMELEDITFCPHGRPVAMELSHKTLDKQFERC